jgi:hypothetical protein
MLSNSDRDYHLPGGNYFAGSTTSETKAQIEFNLASRTGTA